MGDSEDEDDNPSWESDFDESSGDVVDESEIYEIIGEARDDCGDVDPNHMKIQYSEKPRQLSSPPLPPRDSFIFPQDIVTELKRDT